MKIASVFSMIVSNGMESLLIYVAAMNILIILM